MKSNQSSNTSNKLIVEYNQLNAEPLRASDMTRF